MTAGSEGGKPHRKHLWVISPMGGRQRFLRGMITHDLVQRGLDFDEAYATARAIRDRLAERETVTRAELRDLVSEQLETTIGADAASRLRSPLKPPDLHVLYQGQKQPFSRGLLARSIHAAGLDLDRAYNLVNQLRADLRREGELVSPSRDIAGRVIDLLEREESKETARRYQLVRRIHRLSRPLVVYIGGASGTGKSTLALDLAPLLRVYRIAATDTVRQVMRMVFSPNILPALHTSSFVIAPSTDPGVDEERPGDSDDFQERLIASFEEQATRVNVGVRAMVERAIAENMSLVVEGVHLYPPALPFEDLEAAAYQVPLMLATLDEETHRTRFLMRARRGGRKAERFLENFDAVRMIHDHILQQAEHHEVPLIDTSPGEETTVQAVRIITGMLEKKVRVLGPASRTASGEVIPTLLVVIDGLADRPVRQLGGLTPLQSAATPTLDRLAAEGRSGIADPVAVGVVPDTAAGTLAVLGQSPLAMKRGPVEAIGTGLDLEPGDVALRGNLATLAEDGTVVDRRAGRIREEAAELAGALDGLPVPGFEDEMQVRVGVGTEHRLAIVLRGAGLSAAIEGSDPGDGASRVAPLIPRPADRNDEHAARTAACLHSFETEARRVLSAHPANQDRAKRGLLPANAVLTRGAGRVHTLIPLEDAGTPLRICCVGGDRTILGLVTWLGGEVVTTDEMTANLDTDLDAKFAAASAALDHNDLVIVHLKGADIAAHDQEPEVKAEFLERIDRCLGALVEGCSGPLRVVVASDHATLSETGRHSDDPLPVLIWGQGVEADAVQSYDEHSAGAGALGRFPLQRLLGMVFDLT